MDNTTYQNRWEEIPKNKKPNQSISNAEERQTRRNQVLEQFLREQKRKGNVTPIQEANCQRQFKECQDAEERGIREVENQ